MTPTTDSGVLHMVLLGGILAYLAGYRLAVWLGDRRERMHLWIAAFCAAACTFVLGRYVQHSTALAVEAASGSRLQIAAGLMMLATGLAAVQAAALEDRWSPSVMAVSLTSVILAAATVATPMVYANSASLRGDVLGHRWLEPEAGPYQALIYLYMAACSAFTIRVARRARMTKDAERRTSARWAGLLAAPFVANDLLHASEIIDSVLVLEFGLVAVAAFLNHSLTVRHGRVTATAEALQRSEQGLRDLLDGLPDAVVVHVEGRVLFRNGRAYELFGERDDAYQRLFGLDPAGDLRADTLNLASQDGRELACEVVAVPVTFDGVGASATVVRDVTERVAMERQLRLADRMASVGSLATGVAHEINNPLTYTLSALDELAAELEGLPQTERLASLRKLLDEAQDGTKRIGNVVSDVNTFSRAEEDLVDVVSLKTVVEGAIRLTRNQLRHLAHLDVELDEQVHVAVNPARLGQVVVNLLVNAAHAIEASAERDHRIGVRMAVAGDEVTLTIQDSGVGLSSEVAQRAFDPFFTTKRVGEGTGLGLPICHGIITAYGGRMALQEHEERGAIAMVTLPVTDRRVSSPAEPSDNPPASNAPRRVLVVDDEPGIGRALRRMLRAHDVTVATGGAEALDRLAEGSFDVILCDLMMPEVTGMDVYEEVAKRWPGREQRFVFMSGGVFTERAKTFVDEVDNPLLKKPLDAELLALHVAAAEPSSVLASA